MIDKGMMVLQNHLDSQKNVPGLHSETYASSSHGVQAVNIKVEEFSDIEDGEHPVPLTIVGTKTEYEVSFMPLYPLIRIYRLHAELFVHFDCTSVTQNFCSLMNRRILEMPFLTRLEDFFLFHIARGVLQPSCVNAMCM
jgi:hypothetical protein